ncbi:alanine racemase [Nakamurella endophytica]|uniref:Alanine racemase n=1 Tax=Nakamurella endophytica TaxID=1748367 RepID=A0A917WGE0_9ACTN|nr:alanine racemase [Nakamurella endophytica]GGM03049.1 alanine racemase [Nakamurella endophytica]
METPPPGSRERAVAVVDLWAVRANTRALLAAARRAAPGAELMAVVKADGYGHGAAPVAREAVAAGAAVLGVATPGEAVQLRDAGIAAPVVAWLWVPGEDLRPALAAGVQLTVSSTQQLAALLDQAGAAAGGGPVPVHVKVDTGLGRGGVAPAALPELLAAVTAARLAGRVEVVGLMSHLANGEVPEDPSVADQLAVWDRARRAVRAAGLAPRWEHLANTGATLVHPATVGTLVRCGIGLYGLDPVPPGGGERQHPVALRPAMTLRAAVALVKRVPAGHGVSYGWTYRTTRETTLALVPLGYADGIPRAASNRAQVWLAGRRRTVAGQVAMDQFVVDCGDDPVAAGDEVLLFGPGDRGEPTASEWAVACGTIDYEIVTRVGPRVPRRHVSGSDRGAHRTEQGGRW